MTINERYEAYIREKLAVLNLPTELYHVGATTKDTPYVLFHEDGYWWVGSVERGQFRSDARFDDATTGAEYLIMNIKRPELKQLLPDWTDYASYFGADGAA